MTLVGIILSTALLVALMGLVTSFLHTILIFTMENTGNHHIVIDSPVPVEELDELIFHKEVEKYYLAEGVDTYSYESVEMVEMELTTILALDSTSLEINEDKILTGRMPENEQEVMVSMYAEEEVSVGDVITSEEGKSYTVVGTFSYLKMFSAEIVTYMEEPTESAFVSLRYKNPSDYEEITSDLIGDKEYAYYYNTSLLQLEGNAISSQNKQMIYYMAFVIALIVVVTSVFCIRNSFAISITEKTRQYGMLASVGATPKQIRKNVLFEGLILGGIGIPIGVISGIFAVFVLLAVTNHLLADISNTPYAMYIQWIPTLCAVMLSAITIYFSSIGSALRASRISEIDAIRSTADIKNSAKSFKIPRYVEKIFNIGGVFAFKNMKRNKKKFRTTTISLVVSISTYIALSSFLNLGFQMATEQYDTLGYNVEILNVDSGVDIEELRQEVSQMTENDLCIYQKWENIAIGRDAISEEGQNYYLSDDMEFGEYSIFAFNDAYFLEYQESIGLEGNLNQAMVYDTGNYYVSENEEIYFDILEFQDTLDLWNSDYEKIAEDLSIVRIKDLPISGYTNNVNVYVSNAKFEELFGSESRNSYVIYVNSEDPDELVEQLEAYQETEGTDFLITNLAEMQRQNRSMLITVSIFLYGFIAVIILVGLTNIFNSLSTNMNLRRKEFATLQSIGMTSKEFNKMITFESLTYAAKSLLWGIPLGTLGSYAFYVASTAGDYEVVYEVPFGSIAQASIVVILVVYAIMKTSLNKIANQNIIETIRNENI